MLMQKLLVSRALQTQKEKVCEGCGMQDAKDFLPSHDRRAILSRGGIPWLFLMWQ